MIDYLRINHQTEYQPISTDGKEALKLYESIDGRWTNYCIGDDIIFTHRVNAHNLTLFPDQLASHTYYEVAIIKEGDVSYIADQYDFIPENGEIIIIPPGCLHCTKMIHDCCYDRYILYFSKNFFTYYGKYLPPDLFRSDSPQQIKLNVKSINQCFAQLNEIEEMVSSQKNGRSLLSYALLINFFFFISDHSSHHQTSLKKLLPDNFLKIKNYIDDNFCNISTVNYLAVIFSYSREYLSRMFSYHLNISISEYIRIKKMEEAKNFLRSGHSVTDTYLHVGYANMTSFIIAFKKYCGQTPRQFRNGY